MSVNLNLDPKVYRRVYSTASLIARKAHAIADDNKRISVIEQHHNTQTVVQEKSNYGDRNDENHRTSGK